jgi:hypothetical protein
MVHGTQPKLCQSKLFSIILLAYFPKVILYNVLVCVPTTTPSPPITVKKHVLFLIGQREPLFNIGALREQQICYISLSETKYCLY